MKNSIIFHLPKSLSGSALYSDQISTDKAETLVDKLIQKTKHTGTFEEITAMIRSRIGNQLLLANAKGRSLQNIHRPQFHTRYSTLSRELQWLIILLNQEKEHIKKYHQCLNLIDKYITSEDFCIAKEKIEEIALSDGWSLTLLERALSVGSRLEDESYLNKILLDILSSNQDDLIKFASFAIYYRVNPLISSIYYKRLFSNNLNSAIKDDIVKSIIKLMTFSFDGGCDLKPNELPILIYSLGVLPLYDQYECLLNVIQVDERSLSRDTNSPYREFIKLFKKLNHHIGDNRVAWLLREKVLKSNCTDSNTNQISNKKSTNYFTDYVNHHTFMRKLTDLLSVKAEVELKFSEIETWIIKQPRHPSGITYQTFLAYLQGEVSFESITKVALRHDPQVFKTTRFSSRVSIHDIKSCVMNLDLLTAKQILDAAISKAIKDLSTIDLAIFVYEIIDQYPFFIPALKKIPALLQFLSKHKIQEVFDLPVLVVHHFLAESITETSIRIDEILRFKKITNPSQLFLYQTTYDKSSPQKTAKITFAFYLNVCTIPVLEQIPFVGTTESEVLEERLSILRNLASSVVTSPTHISTISETINNEISSIIKRKKINSIATIDEKSRLRVDANALVSKIKPLFQERTVGDLRDPNTLTEFQLTFLGLFLFDEDHGLDAELSGRIRHGKLRERLLSPFLSNQVFSKPNEPENSEFKLLDLSTLNAEKIKEYEVIIENSRLAVISYINEFVGEKAHLRMHDISWSGFPGLLTKNVSPKGLICITKLRDMSIVNLHKLLKMESNIDLDIVLEKCVESIWSALGDQLIEVKSYINTTVNKTLLSEVDKFETEIKAKGTSYNKDLLMHCRSQINIVCTEVSNWFSIPGGVNFPESNLTDLIELATSSVEACNNVKLDCIISNNLRNITIPPCKVGDCYDLMILFVSNVVKHGTPTNNRDEFSMEIYDENLNIVVKNQSRKSANDNAHEAKSLIEDFRDRGINVALNREEKSGFSKIIRLLRKIKNQQKPEIHVYTQGQYFCVKFPIQGLQ